MKPLSASGTSREALSSNNDVASEQISSADGTQMEMDQMASSDEPKLPLHEDIMQLAMLGEIGPIQKLIQEGKFPATHKDREGITPLHVSGLE